MALRASWDVLQLLRKHLDTTIATCARKASAEVNDLATEVLFKDLRKTPLGTLRLEYEINEANFDMSGKLKARIKLEPATADLHEGQRVFRTRSLDTKEVDQRSNVTSYPARLGYSTTAPKIQGAIRRRSLR